MVVGATGLKNKRRVGGGCGGLAHVPQHSLFPSVCAGFEVQHVCWKVNRWEAARSATGMTQCYIMCVHCETLLASDKSSAPNPACTWAICCTRWSQTQNTLSDRLRELPQRPSRTSDDGKNTGDETVWYCNTCDYGRNGSKYIVLKLG